MTNENESYWYEDEELRYAELLKQDLPSGIDEEEECDEDDQDCLDAQNAKETQAAAAAAGNVAMRKGSLTEWQFTFPIHKANPNDPSQDPSVLYGLIYPSCEQGSFCTNVDSQGDFASSKDVRAAAHGFMTKYGQGRARVTVQHGKQAKASVVESFIAPTTFQLPDGDVAPQGSWVGAVKVHDKNLMSKIESGNYQAFSIGGTGTRISNPGQIAKSGSVKGPTQLVDLDIDELSIVGRGANMRKFAIVRKMDFENNMEDVNMNMTEETNPDFELAEFEKMAVEIKKSNPGLSDEQAYTSAVHAQPELYSRYLEKLMNLQKAAQEQEYPIQKESDLPPEVADSIVILKEFVEKMGQSSNPELQGYSEVTAEILRKSAEDGIEKSEPEAFSEAVYAVEQQAPGTYANYLSRISQLHM